MLRIFFTAQDIARTRLAPSPDPLWEMVLSLQMLRGQRGDLLFSQWRRETARTLRRAELGSRLDLLLTLSPELGYFPDFITPTDALRGLEYGLEAIRCAPKTTMRHELALLAQGQQSLTGKRLKADVSRLARGETAAVTELTQAMQTYYELAIQPHERGINAAVQADRNVRLDAFAQAGIEGMLGSLRPMMTWEAGELQVQAHRDQEIHLDGRGLLIIPSYFCVNHPMTMFDPTLPPVLIYPVPRSPETLPQEQRVALSALIGQTRAAMLESIGSGCTTSELARRAGVSAASASEHATILRCANLITSHRDRNRVVHHVTPLGLALLNGL